MPVKPTSTLERALVILYHCAEHAEGVSFSALKEVAGDVASMTLSRILATLIEHEDLIKDEQTGLYKSGPRFLQMAQSALGQQSLDDLLAPVVKQLALRCNEPAAYFHWDQDWMYIRLKHELPENFSYTVLGARNHPLEHTFFRSIQSALSVEERTALGVDLDAGFFEKIASDGYYQQYEKYRYPVFRITAPVFYGEQEIAGAIGITSLINDLHDDEIKHIINNVCESAREASGLLANMERQQ